MTLARVSLFILLLITAAAGLLGAGLALASPEKPFFDYRFETLLLMLLFFAILAPLVNVLHRAPFRMGGIALYLLFLGIWMITLLITYEWIESSKWTTTLYGAFIGALPGGIALLFRKKPWAPFFSWTMAAVCYAATGLILIPAWLPSLVPQVDSYYYVAFTLLIYGTLGSLLLVNVGRGDRRYFRWPAVLIALATLSAGIVAAIDQLDWNDPINYWAHLGIGVTGTLGFINILLMTKRRGLVRLTKWFAITFMSLTGIAYLLFIRDGHRNFGLPAERWTNPSDFIPRSLTAGIFLTMAAILCQLIARTMVRLVKLPTSPTGIDRVQVTCPNCHTPGPIALKNGACAHCLLQFRITLIEPKCPQCDYLLLNVTSARCPECGHALTRPAPAALPTLTPSDPPLSGTQVT